MQLSDFSSNAATPIRALVVWYIKVVKTNIKAFPKWSSCYFSLSFQSNFVI